MGELVEAICEPSLGNTLRTVPAQGHRTDLFQRANQPAQQNADIEGFGWHSEQGELAVLGYGYGVYEMAHRDRMPKIEDPYEQHLQSQSPSALNCAVFIRTRTLKVRGSFGNRSK